MFLTLLAAGSLLSQADRGTITGAVTDPNGAAVAGARVTVVNVDTRVKQTTTTTAAGEWTFPSMPVGTYRATVENEGFKTATREGGTLDAGSTLRMDIKLEIGALQQTMTVKADSTMTTTMGSCETRFPMS